MLMKILLIRHAEPDYENNSLTEKGFREADMLAEKLKKCPITDVYSSPISRAYKTAIVAADALGKKVDLLDWMQEFCGKLIDTNGSESIPWNQLPREWTCRPLIFNIDTWLMDSKMSSLDVPQKYKEVTDGLDELLKKYGYHREGVIYKCNENMDITIALFCHFGVGMLLASHLTGISPVLLWQSMFLPTSSVTTFVTEERVKGEVVFKCMQMGDTSHLYVKGEEISRSGLYPEFFGGDGCGPAV